MRPNRLALVAAILFALTAAPGQAGWKAVAAGQGAPVAKSALTVTPAEPWNRWTVKPIPKGEVWTLDGTALNELYFVTGLVPGETLFRDNRKKDRPLPKLAAAAQLTDLPEFFESSQRIVLDTSMFELTGSEPAKLAGRDAIRFSYRYAVQGSSLVRKGFAVATLVNGQLTLIAFNAPETFFFERDRPKVEAIMNSARL